MVVYRKRKWQISADKLIRFVIRRGREYTLNWTRQSAIKVYRRVQYNTKNAVLFIRMNRRISHWCWRDDYCPWTSLRSPIFLFLLIEPTISSLRRGSRRHWVTSKRSTSTRWMRFWQPGSMSPIIFLWHSPRPSSLS